MACFLERRHGNAAGAGGELGKDDRRAFTGFNVRTEVHAKGIHALLHAPDVGLHAGVINDRGGGVDGQELFVHI